jgi:hypothetical protein
MANNAVKTRTALTEIFVKGAEFGNSSNKFNINTIDAEKFSSDTEEFKEITLESNFAVAPRNGVQLMFNASMVEDKNWKITIPNITSSASENSSTQTSAGSKVYMVILAQNINEDDENYNNVYYFRTSLPAPESGSKFYTEEDGKFSLDINLSEKKLPDGKYQCYAWNEFSNEDFSSIQSCDYNKALGKTNTGTGSSWEFELKSPEINFEKTEIETKSDYTEEEVIKLLGITATSSYNDDAEITQENIKIENFNKDAFSEIGSQNVFLKILDSKQRYSFVPVELKVVSLSDKIEFKDKNSGIIAKVPKGLLPENTKLIGTSILKDSDNWKKIYENIDPIYKSTLEKFSAFDLDFIDSESKKPIDLTENKVPIDIYVPIQEEFDAEEVYALYVNILKDEKDEYHDESELWIDPETEKKYCHFQVTHLSPYAIIDPITTKNLEEAKNAPKDVKAGYSNLNWFIFSGVGICSLAIFLSIVSKKEDEGYYYC